jgi:serine/threonine protein kinase
LLEKAGILKQVNASGVHITMPKRVRGDEEGVTGGKFIGKGSFGCTFAPALATRNEVPPNPRLWLGKVMPRVSATDEVKHMAALRKIDPKQRFGLYSVYRKPEKLSRDVMAVVKSAGGVAELAKCATDDFEGKDMLKDTEDLRQILLPKAVAGDMKVVMSAVLDARERVRDASAAASTPPLDRDVAAAGLKNYGVLLLKHLRAFRVLLAGLVLYHSKDLVHADIKPANVVLASGTWRAPLAYKFIDFGLVESVVREAQENEASWYVAGTQAYMPLVMTKLTNFTTQKAVENHADLLHFLAVNWFPRALKDKRSILELASIADKKVDHRVKKQQQTSKLTSRQDKYIALRKYGDVFALTLTFSYMYSAVGLMSFEDSVTSSSWKHCTLFKELAPSLSTYSSTWEALLMTTWKDVHEAASYFVNDVLGGAILDAPAALVAFDALIAKAVKVMETSSTVAPDAAVDAEHDDSSDTDEDTSDDGSSTSSEEEGKDSGGNTTSAELDVAALKQDLEDGEHEDPDADVDDEAVVKQRERELRAFLKNARAEDRKKRSAHNARKRAPAVPPHRRHVLSLSPRSGSDSYHTHAQALSPPSFRPASLYSSSSRSRSRAGERASPTAAARRHAAAASEAVSTVGKDKLTPAETTVGKAMSSRSQSSHAHLRSQPQSHVPEVPQPSRAASSQRHAHSTQTAATQPLSSLTHSTQSAATQPLPSLTDPSSIIKRSRSKSRSRSRSKSRRESLAASSSKRKRKDPVVKANYVYRGDNSYSLGGSWMGGGNAAIQ